LGVPDGGVELHPARIEAVELLFQLRSVRRHVTSLSCSGMQPAEGNPRSSAVPTYYNILTIGSDSIESCALTHIFLRRIRELSPDENCCGWQEEQHHDRRYTG
jgi:hypothetical protein